MYQKMISSCNTAPIKNSIHIFEERDINVKNKEVITVQVSKDTRMILNFLFPQMLLKTIRTINPTGIA